MKKTLLTLLVAATATFTGFAQSNLLKNGDFEKWNGNNLAAWGAKGSKEAPTATNVEVKQATGRTGHGAEITEVSNKGKFSNVRLSQKLSLKKGDYTLTFWAKGAVNGKHALGGYVCEDDGAIKTSNYNYSAKTALSKDSWTEVKYNFSLQGDSTVWVILRNDKGAGSIFVDDAMLTTTNGGSVTPDPTPDPTPTPTPTGDEIYSKALTDNADGWTLEQGTLPKGLSHVWAQDAKYGLKASAFVKPNKYAAEAWAISPEITLTKNNKLAFDHAARYFKKAEEELTLWVREGKTGAWQQLTIPTYSDGKSWNYVSSGEIDLSTYEGKTVQIGFKYTSTTEDASTWEVKNFKITGTPSAIESLSTGKVQQGIFDLSGRRVENATKGIFIINGKKVMK